MSLGTDSIDLESNPDLSEIFEAISKDPRQNKSGFSCEPFFSDVDESFETGTSGNRKFDRPDINQFFRDLEKLIWAATSALHLWWAIKIFRTQREALPALTLSLNVNIGSNFPFQGCEGRMVMQSCTCTTWANFMTKINSPSLVLEAPSLRSISGIPGTVVRM
jgi:hypothetical protein